MLKIFIFTINAILPVILLMLLGYILKRIGFFTKDFLKMANKAVFYVFLPTLLFKNISDVTSITDINWSVIAVVIAVVVILFLVGLLITKLIKSPKDKGVVLQCVFRSNFALIGVSLAEMIGGAAGVRSAAIISAFSIPIYNILAVIALSVFSDEKQTDVKQEIITILKKILTNPLIIGVVSGIVVLVVKPFVMDIVSSDITDGFSFITVFISYVARVASPLSLIVLGGQFDFSRVAGYRQQIFISVFARNFMAPGIGLGLAIVLNNLGYVSFDAGVYASLIALFGTPVAVSSAIMAEEMGSNGQLAGQLVVWTTVVSAFSLFIIIFMLRLIGVI